MQMQSQPSSTSPQLGRCFLKTSDYVVQSTKRKSGFVIFSWFLSRFSQPGNQLRLGFRVLKLGRIEEILHLICECLCRHLSAWKIYFCAGVQEHSGQHGRLRSYYRESSSVLSVPVDMKDGYSGISASSSRSISASSGPRNSIENQTFPQP